FVREALEVGTTGAERGHQHGKGAQAFGRIHPTGPLSHRMRGTWKLTAEAAMRSAMPGGSISRKPASLARFEIKTGRYRQGWRSLHSVADDPRSFCARRVVPRLSCCHGGDPSLHGKAFPRATVASVGADS